MAREQDHLDYNYDCTINTKRRSAATRVRGLLLHMRASNSRLYDIKLILVVQNKHIPHIECHFQTSEGVERNKLRIALQGHKGPRDGPAMLAVKGEILRFPQHAEMAGVNTLRYE